MQKFEIRSACLPLLDQFRACLLRNVFKLSRRFRMIPLDWNVHLPQIETYIPLSFVSQ